MKFYLAILTYLLIGAVLGIGILLTLSGKPWLLIAAAVAYLVAFGRLGCKSH